MCLCMCVCKQKEETISACVHAYAFECMCVCLPVPEKKDASVWECMGMCVLCVFVFMCVWKYLHACTGVRACVRACMHVHAHTLVICRLGVLQVFLQLLQCGFVAKARVSACAHACIYVHMCAGVHVCIYVNVCVCIYVGGCARARVGSEHTLLPLFWDPAPLPVTVSFKVSGFGIHGSASVWYCWQQLWHCAESTNNPGLTTTLILASALAPILKLTATVTLSLIQTFICNCIFCAACWTLLMTCCQCVHGTDVCVCVCVCVC